MPRRRAYHRCPSLLPETVWAIPPRALGLANPAPGQRQDMEERRTRHSVNGETLGIAIYGAGVVLLLVAMFLTLAVIGITLTELM